MSRPIYAIFFIILSLNHAYGKTPGEISGFIHDHNSSPVKGVIINLLKATDSSLTERTLTNDQGYFYFTGVSSGEYIIYVQSINYEPFYTKRIDYDGAKATVIPPIYLNAKINTLKDIVINTQKPLIERKDGKVIVNITRSITGSGKSAWDLLQASPGVSVDNNNAISIQGKNGVMIYIDGRPTYLSIDQVVARLKNMNADNIQSIEISAQPSSQYDAQGTAGIINIITKKNAVKGTSGSISASYNQGAYPEYSFDGSISHRLKQISIYGSADYNNSKGYNDQDITRRFYNLKADTLVSDNRQSIHKYLQGNNFEYKAGFDCFFSDKSTVGIMFNSVTNHLSSSAANISKTFHPGSTLGMNTVSDSKTRASWINNSLNTHYKKEIDSLGQSVNIDLVYAKFNSRSDQQYTTSYFNQTGDENSISKMTGSLPLDIDIKAGHLDYTLPLDKNTKLSMGIKSSYVQTDNRVEYDTLSAPGKWVRDSSISNKFLFRENINAAYVSFDKVFHHGWQLQAGLRGEITNAKGHQYSPDSTNSRNYFQFFPAVLLQKKFGNGHAAQFSFNRRIDRPDYQDLNPFRYYLDPYLYNIGNPFLQPQISTSLGVSYSLKNYLTASLGYSQISDAMIQVLYQDTISTTAYLKQTNLERTTNIALNISSAIPVAKWFTTNNSMNLFRNSTQGLYQGLQMHYGQTSIQFNSINIFKLPKNYSVEVSGFYNSKVLYGLLFMEKQYQLSFGIQKNIFKNQTGTIKLSVSDVFKNLSSGGSTHINNLINTDFMNRWDSRRASLTFTYKFNSGSKVSNKQHLNNDEQNRIKK